MYDPRILAEPFLELDGRRGEWLLGRDSLTGDFGSSSLSTLATDGRLLSETWDPSVPTSLLSEPTGKSVVDFRASGDPGAEDDLGTSAYGTLGLLLGLDGPAHCAVGDPWDLEVLRLRLSISSSTMSIKTSAGSSRLARLMVRERSWSASRSQPKNCRKSMSLTSRACTFLKT